MSARSPQGDVAEVRRRQTPFRGLLFFRKQQTHRRGGGQSQLLGFDGRFSEGCARTYKIAPGNKEM